MAEGYKDWAAGDILTAADLEDYTVKQSVMRFADASARTTALSSVLTEGMMSYLKDTDSVEVYDGSSWAAVSGGKILQVVSTTKTDTFSTASTSFTDITGLSVSITPTSATSKILVFARVSLSCGAGNSCSLRMMRDSTASGVGAAAGSRLQATSRVSVVGTDYGIDATGLTLDSPASTSALSYHVEIAVQGSTWLVNRSDTDTDSAGAVYSRTASTITVMEVSA